MLACCHAVAKPSNFAEPMRTRTRRCASVAAPAKVNLTLHVVGRRSDGYHLVETLMVPTSLCDTVRLQVGPAGRRTRSTCRVSGSERIPTGPSNLAVRAADAVLEALGTHAEVDIELTKRIPVGAGLGGGSADAGAVLQALPRLLGARLAPATVHGLAVSLGADVAFCVACRPAIGRGIGDALEPVPGFPRLHLVIVVPSARVETRWAYANALKSLTSCGATTTEIFSRLEGGRLGELLHNDLQAGVAASVPDVGRLATALTRAGAQATVMSGSGSAVVGVFASAAAARTVAGRFAPPDRAFAVRVVRRRPVASG